MNVLIVHVHPEPRSFCSSMCRAASGHLRGRGHAVHVSDLYAMGFDPFAAGAGGRERSLPDCLVYRIEQGHEQDKAAPAPRIRSEIGNLLWCDLLLLNFPVLGFSMPAMLKGWIDRVLVPGMAQGGLIGKRVLASATLGAQQHMIADSGIHGALNGMLRHLSEHTLAGTGMTVLPPFADWQQPRIGPEPGAEVLRAYRRRLDQLECALPAVPGPDEADARLRQA